MYEQEIELCLQIFKTRRRMTCRGFSVGKKYVTILLIVIHLSPVTINR